jgi:hypothetical protein
MWEQHVKCHSLAQDLDKKSKVAKKLAPMVFEEDGGERMHYTRQTHQEHIFVCHFKFNMT